MSCFYQLCIFQVINIVRDMVSYAHSLVKDIEFSAEDALRYCVCMI